MPVAHRDLLVVGASAGGLEPMLALLASLPADLPAAIIAVLHLAPHASSILPQLIQRSVRFAVRHPTDGEAIARGTVYVAPPDHHVVVHGACLRLTRSARENGSRPALDPLFRTAARYAGARTIGVVLSGTLDDGSAGLHSIKAAGGVAIVQDPAEAMHKGMPTNAIARVDVDHVLPVARMREVIVRHLAEEVNDDETRAPALDPDETFEDNHAEDDSRGIPSEFACPECHGVLWERAERPDHFRCRTGHAYSTEALLSTQRTAIEEALWSALRALKESAALARRISERAARANRESAVRFYNHRAVHAERHADAIRTLLATGGPDAPPGDGDPPP